MAQRMKDSESMNERVDTSLRALMEANPSSPMAAVRGEMILAANNRWLEVFGFDTLDDLLGRHVSILMTPESFELWRNRRESRVTGRPLPTTRIFDLVHASGRIFQGEFMGFIWPDDPEVLIAMASDVTRRESSIEHLKGSERLYRTIAESVPAGIMLSDQSGRNVYVNELIEKMTGYSAAEMQEGLWIIDPTDKVAPRLYRSAVKEGTGGNDYETQVIRKDGVPIWVSISWSPVRNAEGNQIGVHTAFTDITERKQTEATLRENEQQLRALVDSVPGIIFRCGPPPDYCVEFISDAVEKTTGYPASYFLNKPAQAYLDLVVPETRQHLPVQAFDAVDPKKPYSMSYSIRRKNGEVRALTEQGQGVLSDSGELLCVEGVIFDITEQHEAGQALRQAEERYRLLAENASDVIWQFDMEWHFVYVSQAIRKYGFDPDGLIGRKLIDIVPPEDIAESIDFIETTDWSSGPQGAEGRIVRDDGAEMWVDILLDRVYENGVPVGVQGIARDITERKKTEEALKESEASLRSFVEAIQQPTFLVDINGTVLMANEAIARRFHLDAESFVGQDIAGCILEQAAGPRRACVEEVIRTGKPAEFEDSESATTFRHYVAPVFDKNGNVARLAWIALDITERRNAELALQKAHDDLERAYCVQQEFLNNVTHEIRTPMTAVKAYVEMLLEGIAGELTEQQSALLRKVLASSDNLLGLVSSLLEAARFRSGGIGLRAAACKPGEVAKKAVAAVTPQASHRGIDVCLDVVGVDHVGVYDEQKLNMVLTNLLSNAVKFTNHGSVKTTVAASQAGVEIVVVDSGMGIGEGHVPVIFEEFQQLDYPSRHKPSGFGLGLAIVANAVEAMGATLVLSSVPGTGTAFTVWVPRLEA